MKFHRCPPYWLRVPLIVSAIIGFSTRLWGQTNGIYSYAGTTGSWATLSHWAGGVMAAGKDAVADFSTLNITATRTVTLDGWRIIGTLRFGDAFSASHDQILNQGTMGPLTMEVTNGKAVLENLNRVTTVSTVLAGISGLSITAGNGIGGTVILSAANTFTGGLDITGTIVQLSHSAAANTGSNANAISLLPAASATRLVINGGVTNNSAVNIPSAITGVSSTGLIQQTGTGLATLTGPITINAATTNGGLFYGGSTAANALVLNGPITATVNLTQREGFVRYGGTGSNYNLLIVNNTALLGASDGICPTATVNLGYSVNGTLDLNGFDQTLAGLKLGYNTTPTLYTGTVNLGDRTLTMDGDILTSGSSSSSHVINATTGALNVGSTGRNVIVTDTILPEDLIINQAELTGSGGFFKAGAGTVALNATTGTAPLSVDAGGLSIGRLGQAGTFSVGSLSMENGTRLWVDAGPAGDLAKAGILTVNGVAKLAINQLGGVLPPGLYPFLSYTGTSPGLAAFNLLPVGHSTSKLVDTGSVFALQVTANQRITWQGNNNSYWSTETTGNWRLPSGSADYIDGDDIIFPSPVVRTSVLLNQSVFPSLVTFTNQAPADYTVSASGAYGLGGASGLIKEGSGKATLRTSNSYQGATIVREGTLELDHDATGNTVLTGSSGVSLSAQSTLQLTRNDGAITFNRNLSGLGTVQINPHSSLGGTAAHSVFLTGSNHAFSGRIQLLAPLSGTYRLNAITPTQLGAGAIEVQAGSQVLTAGNFTYPNALSIDGIGYRETGGNVGALRLEVGSVWAGPIIVSPAGARIGAYNGSATVSGQISGGNLNVNGSDGTSNIAHHLILTGNNTYGKTTIGGGSTVTGSASVGSRRLTIGDGGTTGTLGSGEVKITGDGQNGILSFDRLDGYTLAAGQTISNAGDQPTRTFIDVDTRGAGLTQNGQAITLGTAGLTTGGQIRVGQARSGSRLNTDGPITVEQIRVATGSTNGVLNVGTGSVIHTNQFFFGDSINGNASGQQAVNSTVNVIGQMRLGHFATETSVYTLNGGTLTLTGPSPFLTPSTSTAGAASESGDGNINATLVPAITGGGIYLGIDGTGVFNQNGGTVTTNWIVLDNRNDTGPAPNMPSGIDQYNLNDGTLNLRSTWGMIQRNLSAGFSLGGGTIRADNTGTGFGTGANLTIPLDVNFDVSGSGSTLDTNGVGNAFLLTRNILGSGTLTLVGGGGIKLKPTSLQSITASLSGNATLLKEGTGTSSISGNAASFNGAINIAAGRLDLAATAMPNSILLAPTASLFTEAKVELLTLNGGTLLFDPTTTNALTTSILTVNGTVLLDFAKSPLADGSYPVIQYTSKAGTGTFSVAGSTSYRSVTISDTGSAIIVTLANTRDLVWKGAAGTGTEWDLASTQYWSSPTPDNFFSGDSVLFDDRAIQSTVTINSGAAPRQTRVDSSTNQFIFTTTGVGISGGGGLTKAGPSTLTLNGLNAYSGRTEVQGGVLAYSSPASLGSGTVGNSLWLAGAGRLSYTSAVAMDLGIHRDLELGLGGGTLSFNNATATSLTLSGRLQGSEPLSFHSAGAGAGNFILTGVNNGYSGPITVDAPRSGPGGLTVLRIATQSAVPASSSITVNYPAAANVSGNATTLDLANVTLPEGLELNFNCLQTNLSLRSQLTSTGDSSVNGPIHLSGNGIVQFNPLSGTQTLNGNLSAGQGLFTNICYLRGAGGTGILNGRVTLPAGTLTKTDGNTWRLNSSGHSWGNTYLWGGTLALGTDQALVPAAPLVVGQNDSAVAILNLNGFNQSVGTLSSNPIVVGANTVGKAITSAVLSEFTVTQNADNTYAGLISGSVSLVKQGSATLTLAGANTFTGDVAIRQGTLNAGGSSATTLGSPTTDRRTITVTAPGLLNFITNNVYGNGLDNSNLPSTIVDGTTLSSSRYNVLGPVTLLGGQLATNSSDTGFYEGFQFRGGITVAGSGLSSISSGNTKANHLGPDTVFNVEDVVSGAQTDLIVSSPLRNQSGDFLGVLGSLIKAGLGTMELSAASSYSGPTTINAGILLVNNLTGSATGSSVVTINSSGALSGNGVVRGNVVVNPGGTLNLGHHIGILTTGLTSLSGQSVIIWEVSNWAGASGTSFDTLNAAALASNATPESPVTVRVSSPSLTNFTALGRSFLLASTGGISGFDPRAYFVETSGFTGGLGTWAVSQVGNDLLLNFSPSTPYTLWAATEGLIGADSAFTADPDKDGFSNLAEFALNSDPKSAVDPSKLRVAMASFSGQNHLTLTLPVRSGIIFTGSTELVGTGSGIRYRIQTGADLNGWNSDIDEVTPITASGLPPLESGWTYRTFRCAAAVVPGGRQFIRGKFEVVP